MIKLGKILSEIKVIHGSNPTKVLELINSLRRQIVEDSTISNSERLSLLSKLDSEIGLKSNFGISYIKQELQNIHQLQINNIYQKLLKFQQQYVSNK